jgi:2-dehydropantoate 2-reductase
MASCVQPKAGIIDHNKWTRISVGPFLPHLDSGGGGSRPSDEAANRRTAEFVELLRSGGIPDAELYDHVGLQFARWHKIAVNAAMNPSSVLSGGSGNQELSQDPELAIHTKGIMNEVLSAAPKVLGKEIPWKELKLATPEQVLRSVSRNTTGSRPSMYWDWVEGRRMELEAILGNPIRICREKGIDMPRVQSLYALLRKAQEKRDADVAKRSRM